MSKEQKFISHMDDSLIHRSKAVMERIEAIPLEFAPHPHYSPDLTPSGFFLFGYIKQKLLVMNSALQTSWGSHQGRVVSDPESGSSKYFCVMEISTTCIYRTLKFLFFTEVNDG
jgi:hypothetical protein